jgi:hypothetical protein
MSLARQGFEYGFHAGSTALESMMSVATYLSCTGVVQIAMTGIRKLGHLTT